MTKRWEYNAFYDVASPGGWSSSMLGGQTSVNMQSLVVGDTVVRTRMQGHLVLGMVNTDPATTVSGWYQIGAPEILFGLYLDKTLAFPYIPVPIQDNPDNEHWLQRDAMSLQFSSYTSTGQGSELFQAGYKFDAGLSQSFAQRGPCTANSAIYLVWSIFSPGSSFWTFNGGNLFATHSCAISTWALIH